MELLVRGPFLLIVGNSNPAREIHRLVLEKNMYLLLEKNTESNHDTGAATLPPLAACDALGTNLQ